MGTQVLPTSPIKFDCFSIKTARKCTDPKCIGGQKTWYGDVKTVGRNRFSSVASQRCGQGGRSAVESKHVGVRRRKSRHESEWRGEQALAHLRGALLQLSIQSGVTLAFHIHLFFLDLSLDSGGFQACMGQVQQLSKNKPVMLFFSPPPCRAAQRRPASLKCIPLCKPEHAFAWASCVSSKQKKLFLINLYSWWSQEWCSNKQHLQNKTAWRIQQSFIMSLFR